MKLVIQTVFSPISPFRLDLLGAYGIDQGRDGRLTAEDLRRSSNYGCLICEGNFDRTDPLCELLVLDSSLEEGGEGFARGGKQWGLEPLLRSIYLDQGMSPGLMFLTDDEEGEVRVGLASAERVRWYDGPDLVSALTNFSESYPGLSASM